MPDLEISFATQTAFGTGINYDMTETHNGSLLHTVTNRTVTHGHGYPGQDNTISHKIRTSIIVNAITSGFVQISVLFRVHAVQVERKELNITSVGSFSVSAEWNVFGGLVQGPPTYIETLDKLDQYSKAQYIPNRR